MPKITTRRGEIWYAEHRHQPDKPTLVLVHGAGGSHLDFPLALRRLNSIVPDLPGHGKTGGAGYDDVHDYADCVIAVLDALHIEQAVIAGHSLGGATVQTVALDHLQRVQGLILLTTGAHLPVSDAIIKGIRTDTLATVELLMKWEWTTTVAPEMKAAGLKLLLQTDPNVIYGDYVACTKFDARPRLGEIQAPTLVIGGTVDKMTPPAWSEYLAQHIPHTTLHIVEGGGHMVMVEQADVVAGMVAEWLATIGQT
jgi:pimeloyl-ACP methyl ester carboxylesterase